MIELALVTGIAPSAWADEGEAAIATAEQLLEQARRPTGRPDGHGRQMAG